MTEAVAWAIDPLQRPGPAGHNNPAIFPAGGDDTAMPGGWGAIVSTIDAQRQRLILWLPVFIGVGIGLYFVSPVEPPAVLPAFLAAFVVTGLAAACRYPAFRPIILLPLRSLSDWPRRSGAASMSRRRS